MPTFHFDLRHLGDASTLDVMVAGRSVALQQHDDDSRAAAATGNAALAALPASAREAFTHVADVPDEHVATQGVRYVQVVEPAAEGVHLAEVKLMGIHLPEGHLRAYYAKRLPLAKLPVAQLRGRYRASLVAAPRLFSPKLSDLGLQQLPDEDEAAVDVLVAAQYLVGAIDTGAALVTHHPQLANVQPYTKAIVLHDHVLPDPEVDPAQYNTMKALGNLIAATPSWSPVVRCTDHNGNPMSAGYDLKDKDGKGFSKGQALYTYGLDEHVQAAASAGVTGARRTASDDTSLTGKTWAATPGTSVIRQPVPATSAAGATDAGVGDAAFKWTVTERTDHHGVTVDPASIKLADGTFSIDASNTYLRTLYVGYQLLDDQDNPIGKRELLYSVSATNTILGYPVWTDPTSLKLKLGDATKVQLLFGSLGVTDWEEEVSWRGALLTGLWQYGVPIVFMAAGKAITSSETFNKIANDPDLIVGVIGVAIGVLGGAVPTAAALMNTKVLLFGLGDAILGIALSKGCEKLGEYLLEQVAAGELASAWGPVGWFFKLAAAGLSIEEMAVTTGESLSSPACIKVTAARAIDVTLTLHPDPKHGEAGHPETAVWPAIAKKYVATLQYKSATSFKLEGELPSVTSGTPLPLTFADVPAGGTFRIIVGVYSASGWLAGSWQSDWMAAQPNSQTALALGDKSITEKLVPLAPDTQYRFKERIASDGHAFTWVAGGAPPATPITALDCGSAGTLCELVGLTINNSAFQVGYAWRASGQNLPPDAPNAPASSAQLYALQNLSVLAEPGSRLRRSGIGLTDRPAIAYSPSVKVDNDQIDQTNFIIDPRGGAMNLRKVTLDENRTTFGLEDPGLQSWGSLPLENVDAAAVHPSNALIACSWKDHKLMLLDLPDSSSSDAKAPTALMISGQGLREGLMQGPRALAVAPDGRILVLETINKRVQAFDTKGNGVPSFTPGPAMLTLDTSAIAGDLTAGAIPRSSRARSRRPA